MYITLTIAPVAGGFLLLLHFKNVLLFLRDTTSTWKFHIKYLVDIYARVIK